MRKSTNWQARRLLIDIIGMRADNRWRVPVFSVLVVLLWLAYPAASMEASVTVGNSWVWQNPLPQGDTLNGVSCPNTTVCYAVGGPGTIISTTNSGANWNGQSTNTNLSLRAISCPSTTTCAAVGDQGTVLFTNSSGSTWTKQSIGTTAQLTAVSCPTTNICYALSPTAGIWRTTSLGSSAFEELTTVTGLTAISCPSPATDAAVCYVAGGGLSSARVAALAFHFTTFGGFWSVNSLPIPAISGSLTGISCPSDSTCVAVTNGNSAQSGFNMIGTTNSGQSWNGAVAGASLQSVSCMNAILGTENNAPLCYAVGDAATPNNEVFVANPGAVNLVSPVSASDPFERSDDHGILLGVSCQPAEVRVAGLPITRGMCWAVGWGGAIVTDSPSGSTWTGQETTVGQSQGLLQNGNEGEIQSVSCPQPGTCYATGNGTGFLASTNGSTWTVKNSTVSGSALSCPSTSVCFIGGQNSLLATTNGGTTWAQQYPSGLNPNIVTSMSCPATTICVADGIEYSLFTTNGTTWSVVTPIGAGNAVSCPSTTECVGVIGSNIIFTTNLGATGTKWTIAGTATNNNLAAVSCPTATQCFAVGDTGGASNQPGTFMDGRFNTSTNTWFWQVLTPPTQLGDAFSGISCLPGNLFPNNLCYATTFGGEILSYTTSFGNTIFNVETAIDQFPGFQAVSCAAALVSASANYQCVAAGYEATILSKNVGSIGTGALSPSSGTSEVGKPTTFQLTWTVPTGQVWRDLAYVELKLSGATGVGLWGRFIPGQPASSFALLDANGNIIAEGSAGMSGVLDSSTATLDLSQSGFTAAGPTSPTVTANFVVTFKASAANGSVRGDGQFYNTFISAANLAGTVQAPEQVGQWVVLVSGAPASGTACNGVYNQTFSGDLTVVSGQSCIFVGGGVTGNIAVKGGDFEVRNAAVAGNVEIDGASTFGLGAGATIEGNLQIHDLAANAAQNQVCGANVRGNLEVHNNASAVSVGDQASCSGSAIGGNLLVHNNNAATTVDGNTVGGDLQDNNNNGATEVFKNAVQGVLGCVQNTSITGGQNTAKQKEGQCSGF